MHWYALHVRSQSEGLVAAQLVAEGIEAFYPHMATKSKDNKRSIETRFMPGYVFGRFLLAEKTPVVAIPQVVGILGFGTHAVAIPTHEIEAVRLIVSLPKLAALPCAYVATGDRVRVKHGPLRGLVGYVAYLKNTVRVIVSIEMLARSISAEVDAQSLEVVERADLAAAA